MALDLKRVQAIFRAALETRDQKAREYLLDWECGQDAELRRRVQELLDACERDEFLLGPPAELERVDTWLAAGADAAPKPGVTNNPSKPKEPADSLLSFLLPPTRPDSFGRLGHYEVLDVLGRGGFGIVLKAFDDVLHRVVAVKMLSPELAATSPARKR